MHASRPLCLPRLGTLLLLFLVALGLAGCDLFDDDDDGGGGGAAPLPTSLTVSGTILFDDDTPVAGAAVDVSSVTDADVASLVSAQLAAVRTYYTSSNAKSLALPQTQTAPVERAQFAQVQAPTVTTDADGRFQIKLDDVALPARILVEVSYESTDPPIVVDSARWEDAEVGAESINVGNIMIPSLAGTEVTLQGGAGETEDGSVRVENLPPEVDRFFASSFDPGDQTDASADADVFPGDFSEMGDIPLNSAVFAWLEALDANGAPVNDLSQAATLRIRVPTSQWPDLEDINAGTDRIEVPIYFFNETTNLWEQEPQVGWLEDANTTVLPEDAEPTILDGTFAGELFATFATDHFSWMNVDYAYIGPWTLSRLDSSRRNDDCLFDALQLAKTIALSEKGRTAYGKVNKSGADLGEELSDANGPELKNADLTDEYGVYRGDAGGSETQFEIANNIWTGCGEGATETQKKNTTFIMAVTILHETAHWKDDVKKHSDTDPNSDGDAYDTPGEEGNQLEKDLFGGIITGGADGIKSDGTALDQSTVDDFLNPDNWPAPTVPGGIVIAGAIMPQQEVSPVLQVTIALEQPAFDLGADIPVNVTYRNISGESIEVMNRVVLEGYPLRFNIINQQSSFAVAFIGPESKLRLEDADFTALAPGEELTVTVNLVRNSDGVAQYQLVNSGTFEVTAVYESFRGVPETVSNTLSFVLNPGGSISGTVTSADTAEPIAGATVKVLDGQNELVSAVTAEDGSYNIPELPAGTYTVEASAPGFLRTTQDNVQVTTRQNTVVNFSLSSLLAAGEMRLVLSWGESPSDLDSHLWLPAETSYHVYYSREGTLSECPFAELDVDDTSSFGPETITIAQRFPGTYTYAVFNYSEFPSITTSQARVDIFDSSGLIASYDVPTEGSGLWWHVVNIDGETGAITGVNAIVSESPEPYQDTDIGCSVTTVSD